MVQDDYIQDLIGVLWTRTRDFVNRRFRKKEDTTFGSWGVPNQETVALVCRNVVRTDFINTTINYCRIGSCRTV